ncbi:MAG: hypothetical protein H8E08_00390 [Candidatus Marinimicrobia bacterium]|nr:hypothetical protein [Candidatus Neomarinimicrobiota bacterium]
MNGINYSLNLMYSKSSFDIQGHRGARGLAPENTLAGFRTAIDLGVSTLELDIGVTKDGIPIIFHDTAINPQLCLQLDGQPINTNSLGHGPFIKDLTLAEIKSFDCGTLNPDLSRFPEPPRVNIPGEKIPTLQEFFDLLNEFPEKDIWCNIELKTNPNNVSTHPINEFADPVLQVIELNNRGNQVNIQSFHWTILQYIRNQRPEILLAGLMGSSSYKSVNDSTPSPWLNGIHFEHVGGSSLAILEEAKHYIDIFSPSWRLIMPTDSRYLGSTVKEIQSAGFKVIPWTVNQTNTMRELIKEGVDGIITDYPDSLKFILDKLNIPVK